MAKRKGINQSLSFPISPLLSSPHSPSHPLFPLVHSPSEFQYSLAATVHSQRADLLTSTPSACLPIPLNPPKFFFKGSYLFLLFLLFFIYFIYIFFFFYFYIFTYIDVGGKIPGVGELMLASFPLPEQFTSNFFETFWYIFPTSNHIFLLIFINIICNFVSSQFTHSIFFYLLKHSGGWERSTMECDSVGAPTSMCCIFSLLPSSLSVSHSLLPLNCIFMYIFILSYLSPVFLPFPSFIHH